MIQDITPYQFHNEYQPQPPADISCLLCYKEGKILVAYHDGTVDYPRLKEMKEKVLIEEEALIYLFRIDGQAFYLMEAAAGLENSGYTWEKLEIFREAQPKYLAFAGITGAQLSRWYGEHKYCGHCKTPLEHSDAERMLYCPECKQTIYPKLSPAVIVAITHGNKLLMSKYAGREYTNYALIAGFAEIGESIEDTVRREVKEEVGLEVKNITYYKSQPWSFTDTLLFGFYVELDGDEKITLDQTELAMAEWFEREEIPVEPHDLSLTNEMIIRFKNGEV